MAKIRFTLNNLVDIASSIVATSEVATLPIENTQDMSRGKVYRSAADSTAITITLAADYDVSTFTLGQHNFSENTSVAYTFMNSVGGTIASGTILVSAEQAVETSTTINYADIKNFTYYSEDVNNEKDLIANCRSLVLNITKGTGTNTYFEIGRIFLGDFIQPTYNISYGHNLSFEEQTTHYRTDSGSLRSDMALPYKRFDFSMNTISESDRQILQRGFADVGKRRDFMMSVFPCDVTEEKVVDYSGIVKLTRIPKFQEFQHNFYKAKYVMEEV